MARMHRGMTVFVTCSLLLVAGCAEKPKFEKARSEMTQREKDSVIAASGLPGSSVVKKGMSIADGQAKRAAMMDSITDGN